jgi:hypothetical protein
MTAGREVDAGRGEIPVEEAFAAWRAEPSYVAAYDDIEDEFADLPHGSPRRNREV